MNCTKTRNIKDKKMKKHLILITLVITFLFSHFGVLNTSFASSDSGSNFRMQNKIEKYKSKIYMPDISFFDESEKKCQFYQYEGKTLLVTFWATWCSSCVKVFSELDNLQKDFKKLPFKVIALSQDYQGIDLVKQFYKEKNIENIDIFHDYQNTLFKYFNLSGLPTSLLVDEEGAIIMKIVGHVDWNKDHNRYMLLSYIKGNHPLPRNSSKEESVRFYNQENKKEKEVNN
jgi:thiol-disulfide isomerase/thioredoxin